MEGGLFFKKAVVVGVGLIGGSIARVMKNRGLAGKVTGVGRGEENLKKAAELKVVDDYFLADRATEAVKEADLVILCGPVLSIIPTLETLAGSIPSGALVTDAGSTKRSIVSRADEIARANGFHFIGSHPIAGTERSGVEASFETLFEDHRCILTPTGESHPEALEKAEKLWEAAGMKVSRMEAEEHDRVFSAISHLPHMVVFALVDAVADMDGKGELALNAAGGFKTYTRIASSPPEMWADIALANSDVLREQVAEVRNNLQAIEKAMAEGDRETLLKMFKKSNQYRSRME